MICTMLELAKDSLVFNIVNKVDTVLVKITRFRAVHYRNCVFYQQK